MSDLAKCVEQAIRLHGLFSRGQHALVAVSGGLDSMVLLHVLHQLSTANRWQLVVAHLNHQLRGANSDADENLVRRVSKRLGLELVVERAEVRTLSDKLNLSLEMAARKARHEFLCRAAERWGMRTVALAHHADDQVELFLLRLLRGSGGEGLSGMKWRGKSAFNRRVELVRPLLGLTKAALRRYAFAQRISFREDASNASLDIQRNRIRHELIPLLQRKYQPAIVRTIQRVGEIVGPESDFAARTAAEWLKQMRSRGRKEQRHSGSSTRLVPAPFPKLHVAVQRRCLLLQLLEMGIMADFDLIEQLRVRAKKPVAAGFRRAIGLSESVLNEAPPAPTEQKPGNFSVMRAQSGLLMLTEIPDNKFKSESRGVDLSLAPGQVRFGNLLVRWEILEKKGTTGCNRLNTKELFDADKVGQKVLLRRWQRGDRFQPIGMEKAVKLQDFFTNEKVPEARRHRLLLAAAEDGELFWVQGMRISERFKLTSQTRRRLVWSWEDLDA